MTHSPEFIIGDKVHHTGMARDGTVVSVERGAVVVEYSDVPMKGGGNLTGIYDDNWFRTHVGLLQNLSRNEHLYVRRQANQ